MEPGPNVRRTSSPCSRTPTACARGGGSGNGRVGRPIGCFTRAVLLVLACDAAAPQTARRLATRRCVAASSALALASGLAASAEVINRPLCASGVGDGCAALAEGTSPEAALIKDLQAKSAAKKEQRAREAVERYSVNNFGDYFSAAFPPKALVRHADGTYEALTQDVVAAGLKNGTIRYAIPEASGVAGYSTSRAPFAFNEPE